MAGSIVLCLILAITGGALQAIAATIVAYPVYLSVYKKKTFSACANRIFVILNVVLGLASVGAFVLASGEGALFSSLYACRGCCAPCRATCLQV